MVFSTNNRDNTDIDKAIDTVKELLAGKGDNNKYIAMINNNLREIGSLTIMKANSPVLLLRKSDPFGPNAILFLADDYFAIIDWNDYSQKDNHDVLGILSCIVYNDKHLADMLNNVYEYRKGEKRLATNIVEKNVDRLSKLTSITINLVNNGNLIIHYDKHDFVTEILTLSESFALKQGKMIARDEFVSVKIGNSVSDMHKTVSLYTNEYVNFSKRSHSKWKNDILSEALKIYNYYF